MIFKNLEKRQFLFHIPHSSISIPSYDGYISESIVNGELIKLTDWATDVIFEVDGIDRIRTPFSRVFCDVERFNSEEERMNKFGRGVIYTKTEQGKNLRLSPDKESILQYYHQHHIKLERMVDEKLKKYNQVFIIDCHSFPDEPITGEIESFNLNIKRPDICIGFDMENCEERYSKSVIEYFLSLGYSVSVNTPFSGSIVPLKHLGNAKVQSLMIEINRKLYMEKHFINTEKLVKLNREINKAFGNSQG
ncbi:N-formylglutamate amidohydrolase [Aequorivita sp. KMM 9714]|uniref:N-formylglutamate amidohydrolase n=1 Tax=Aequorivita sp. KMM 9714 TaxID=2707173 RepID=UPI0013EA4FF2|nr:N-formylglutamate amidohydrolase [Aequorivita sp. KMM 9714]NGX85349.1 N-formylglutamate amidohydrolase [Aequorivita sp. KMM 9714]